MDKEKNKLNVDLIYPTPDKNIPTQVSADTDISPQIININWFKIFFLGVLTVIIIFVFLTIFYSLGTSLILIIALIFRGLIVPTLFIVFLGTLIGGYLLKKQDMYYPYVISLTSIFIISVFYVAYNHFAPNSFYVLVSGQEISGLWKILNNFFIKFTLFTTTCGALFVINGKILGLNYKYGRFFACLLISISIALLLLIPKLDTTKKDEEYFTKVSETEWAIVPRYLPAGIIDGLGSAVERCSDQILYANSYECQYYFKNYPGYLSSESQKIITDSTEYYEQNGQSTNDSNYAPSTFFRVKIFKDIPALEKYKFSDYQCDIFNLEIVGSSKESEAKTVSDSHPPEKTSCGSKTTSENNIVYFERINLQKYAIYNPLDVPINYYFEKNGIIVVINIASSSLYLEKDQLSSLYFEDSNFESEFFKFIDSFK